MHTESYCHKAMLERMENLGRICPENFKRVMQEEPALFLNLLESMGIHAETAEVVELSSDGCRIRLKEEGSEKPGYCSVRFLSERCS